MTFLKSLKTLFAGQEIEIIVKSIEPKDKELPDSQNSLIQMVRENRQKAPIIAPNINIQGLIDDAQYPDH